MASGSYDIVQEYSQAICTYTDKHGHDPAKLTEFMYDLSCFMREFCINLTKQRAILEEAAEKKQAAARKHKRATGVDLEEEDDGTENPLLAGMPTLLRTEVPSISFILEEAGALAPLLSEIDRNLQQELGKAGANKLSSVRSLGTEGSFGSDSDREEHSYFDDSCMPVTEDLPSLLKLLCPVCILVHFLPCSVDLFLAPRDSRLGFATGIIVRYCIMMGWAVFFAAIAALTPQFQPTFSSICGFLPALSYAFLLFGRQAMDLDPLASSRRSS